MKAQALPRDQLIRLLLERLEHISVDSELAHKASGIRGALIRYLEVEGAGEGNPPEALLAQGFDILEAAAKEQSG
jgi:hypothetical protein